MNNSLKKKIEEVLEANKLPYDTPFVPGFRLGFNTCRQELLDSDFIDKIQDLIDTAVEQAVREEVAVEEEPFELHECQECGDMTPDKGICFMCKETIIK